MTLIKLFQLLGLVYLIWLPGQCLASVDQEVHKALLYMDRGQAHRAIESLLPVHNAHPDNRDVAITLASAYVGLSPITIRDFIPLFKKIRENDRLSDTNKNRRKEFFRRLAEISEGQNDKFLERWEEIYEFTDNLMYILDCLDSLPDIQSDDLYHLERAAVIYQNASFSLTRGDAAFAILVDLTALKFKLRNNHYFSYLENVDLDLGTVSTPEIFIGLESLKHDLVRLLHYTSLIADDTAQINKSIAYIDDHWSKFEDVLDEADEQRLNLLLHCMAFNYDCM